MAQIVGVTYSKEEILNRIQDCVNFVSASCFYCNNCWQCHVTKELQREASKKKLKNTDQKWWSIAWKAGKNPTPFLVSH